MADTWTSRNDLSNRNSTIREARRAFQRAQDAELPAIDRLPFAEAMAETDKREALADQYVASLRAAGDRETRRVAIRTALDRVKGAGSSAARDSYITSHVTTLVRLLGYTGTAATDLATRLRIAKTGQTVTAARHRFTVDLVDVTGPHFSVKAVSTRSGR